jgi:inositol-1,3,4-trisphosphate 5/6-kinase/inositol-tetrakisphosphate 1-kinase
MQEKQVTFPIICKPIQACGSPHSHQLTIVMNEEGLQSISEATVIQNYFPHDGTFYKVYVIGNDVQAFRRPSVQIPQDFLQKNFYQFDSQKLSKQSKSNSISIVSTSLMDRFRFIAWGIKRYFGLSLFGFDVVLRSNTNNTIKEDSDNNCSDLIVVDVNYFPSYKEVDDFPERLLVFLRAAAKMPPWNSN